MPEVDQSALPGGASSEPSDGNAPDLAAIVQKAVEAAMGGVDARFSGFQSLMDKKFGTLAKELKTAGLSDEQREQLTSEEEAGEVEDLKRQLALYQLKDQFPDEVELFQAVMGQGSLEDQLAAIKTWREGRQSSQPPATPEGDPDQGDPATPATPEVDGNNPARPKATNAGDMTDDKADRILAQFSGQGGILSRLRKGQG